MDCFTLIGLCALLYFIFHVFIVCIMDCDVELAYADIFGKKLDKLRGKVVWITEATNEIGEGLAYLVAQNQGKLVLSGMRTVKLKSIKETCLSLNKKLKKNDILILKLNITKSETISYCFQKVLQHFGSIDIIINNTSRSHRAVWENTEIRFDRQIFDFNVFGMIFLSRMAVKYFSQKNKGELAIMSSIAGLVGVAYSGSYTATKHAIHGYYNSLRVEKLGENIHITLLCPGPMARNNIRKSFAEKGNKVSELITLLKRNKERRGFIVPLRRMTAERYAELCLKAIVNKLDEAWIAEFPILALVYGIRYCPNVTKFIMKYLSVSYRNRKERRKT